MARTCSKRTGTRSSGMLCLFANAATASWRLSPSKRRSGTTSPSSRATGNSKRGSLVCLDCWMFLVTASAMDTRRLVTSALSVASESASRELSAPNFSTASLTLSPSNRPRSTRVSAILTGISRNGIDSVVEDAVAASCAEAVAARPMMRSRASFFHICLDSRVTSAGDPLVCTVTRWLFVRSSGTICLVRPMRVRPCRRGVREFQRVSLVGAGRVIFAIVIIAKSFSRRPGKSEGAGTLKLIH